MMAFVMIALGLALSACWMKMVMGAPISSGYYPLSYVLLIFFMAFGIFGWILYYSNGGVIPYQLQMEVLQ